MSRTGLEGIHSGADFARLGFGAGGEEGVGYVGQELGLGDFRGVVGGVLRFVGHRVTSFRGRLDFGFPGLRDNIGGVQDPPDGPRMPLKTRRK